jgi:hypothetical protein
MCPKIDGVLKMAYAKSALRYCFSERHNKLLSRNNNPQNEINHAPGVLKQLVVKKSGGRAVQKLLQVQLRRRND